MKRFLLFLIFLFGNLAILSVSLLFLTIYTSKQSSAKEEGGFVAQASGDDSFVIYDSSLTLPKAPVSEFIAADGRTKLIDDFFTRYGAPMQGLGIDVVSAADKYQIPFGLLPAIAMCEGNLGKVMPNDSFNPYGFGIYGDKITRFSSWQDGIETVSKTLRRDYFDRGLDNPDKIMSKYTPSSNGSWSFCVNRFLDELK